MFEKIYIPRTHLLTQVIPIQWEIPDALFSRDDVAFLGDVGTLRISVRPGYDPGTDTERILSRASHTTRVNYAATPSFHRKFPATAEFIVEGAKEAESNSSSFPEYARLLTFFSPELSKRVLEVAEQASIEDIPFFHEHFLTMLREQLTPEEFDKVWRDTNSIYLITGVPNQRGVIPYFNDAIESADFRYSPWEIDRYLFHPATICTFLETVLGREMLIAFLRAPIQSALGFLRNDGYGNWLLAEMRRSYFELVETMSRSIIGPFAKPILDQRAMAMWFEESLSGNTSHRIAILENAAEDVSAVAHALHPIPLSKELPRLALKQARTKLESFGRRRRFPAIYDFADMLKTTLGQIK